MEWEKGMSQMNSVSSQPNMNHLENVYARNNDDSITITNDFIC